ncbi:MAG TPA: sulfatase-like hydrolase/transferase [Phnomibacter sp.]|nr:sulfatase-like hydrolase/transferase [Phnomibacter sp.]
MKYLQAGVVCCLASMCLILATKSAWGQRQYPNIIIILTDDQGYADVGFNGSTDIATPGIDRIADNGVVCTNAYVSFAVCGPSRAGLITGRYQDRFGFSRNPLLAPKDSTMGLPATEETLAAFLKRSGYTSGILGKWHLGAHPSQHPNQKGFDEFFGFLEGGHRYFPEEWTLNDISEARQQYDGYRTKMVRNQTVVEETEYLTDALSREAVAFVKRNRSNPFFLFVAYTAPHAPLQPTEKYLSRHAHITDERRRTYAAMVSAVDDGVNDLLNTLQALNIEENTLVFFLSDNGGPTKDNASSNKPLRGFKGDFYEGGVRVPFAVQWKGVLPAGTKYHQPVISLDIFGTAAALTGARPKNEIDGVNLIPYLTGAAAGPPHDALYWRGSNSEKWAVRTPDEKMVVISGKQQVYDIRVDVGEKNDISTSVPQHSKQLQALLDHWKERLVPPAFLGLLDDKRYSELNPDRFAPNK